MKQKLKIAFELLRTDIRNNIVPVVLVLAIWIGLRLILGYFCPVVIITGFPCPGCGLTRAVFNLITLHPAEAMRYNPAVVLWVPLFIAAVIQRYFRNGSLSPFKIPLLVVCIITIAVYVWRLKNAFPGHEPMVFMPGSVFGRIHPGYDRAMMTLF